MDGARDFFEGLFAKPFESANLFLSNPDFVDHIVKQGENVKDTLESVLDVIVKERPLDYEDCIIWARNLFEKLFNNDIQQLLFNFPKDAITSSVAEFWSGPKKAPTPITFDINDVIIILLVFGYGCPFQVACRPVVWPFWHACIPYFACIKRTYVARRRPE